MRFGIFISLTAVYSLAISPFSYAQDIDLTTPASSLLTPRIQAGKKFNNLQPAKNFSIHQMSNALGTISAITHDDGKLYYSADIKSGRIWQLKDQNQDGRIDTKRAIAHRFDSPSGLAVDQNRLYVADQNAVWVIDNLNPPRKLAGLRNTESIGAPHVLSLSQDKTILFLGLTTKNQEIRILSINTETGEAALFDSLISNQRLIGFAQIGNAPPWVVLDNSFGPTLSTLSQINPSHKLKGMALPVKKTKNGLRFDHNIYLTRQSSDGLDVLAVPVNLGAVETTATSRLKGFLSSTKRSAWGAPSALLFDKQGLIIADKFNGDLYRLVAKPPSATIPQTPLIETEEDILKGTEKLNKAPPQMQVSTIKGSQIRSASTLDAASDMQTGSTIVRDFKSLASEIQEEKDAKKKDTNKPKN